MRIFLNSSSLVRRIILKKAGVKFHAFGSLTDEKDLKEQHPHLGPKELSIMLSQKKALSLSDTPESLFIGADQVLEFEGKSHNKPRSLPELEARLRAMSGKTHFLHSSVSVARQREILWTHCETAKLTMWNLSDDFIKSYIKKSGKDLLYVAGGYKIESLGIQLFEEIEGDYFSILGLPLLPLLAFLRSLKIETLDPEL